MRKDSSLIDQVSQNNHLTEILQIFSRFHVNEVVWVPVAEPEV